MFNSFKNQTRKRLFSGHLLCAITGLAAAIGTPSLATAQTSVWTNAGSGNWDNAANWDTAFFPNAINADAVFNGANPAANSTVTLNAVDITVGTIQINNPTTSLITGRTIIFNDPVSAQVQFNSGSWTIGSTLRMDTDLTLTGSSTGTITGVIQNGSAANLIKSGSGTVNLNAANTFNGTTTVNDGLLMLNTSNALQNTSGVTLNGDSVLRLGATGTISNAAGVTLNSTSVFDLNGFTETIATLNGAAGTSVTLGNGLLQVIDNVDSVFSGAISGSGNFRKSGSGMMTLNGVNTYSGTTRVDDGVLLLNTGNALQNTSQVTLNGDSIVRLGATGTINNSAAMILNGTSVFDLNGFTETIGTLDGAAGTSVTLGGGELQVIDNVNSVFSGVISEAGNFRKSGTGTMTLNGANTYTGTTRVDDGVLLLNTANALQNTSQVTLNGDSVVRLNTNGTINNAAPVVLNGMSVLDVNGNMETIGSLAGGAATGVTLGAGGSLTTGSAGSTTYNGVISGVGGSLTKVGAGTTFTLNGNNSYTGPTTVNAGRLDMNGGNSSAVTVNNGGTFGGTGSIPALTVNAGGTVAPGNSIGTLTVTGSVTPAYTQAAGGTYQTEINNAGTIPGVNNDLISLTNPVATAALGGTVNVVDTTAGGFYDAGTTFTILTTANPLGVTGMYGAVTTTNLAANRTAVLMHNPNNVQVQLQRTAGNFGANSMTRNQRNVGNVLDNVNALATGDLGTVLDQLVLLPNAAKPAALDQLTGELHAAVAGNVVQTTSRFVDMVSRRLRTNSPGASGIYGPTVPTGGPYLMGSNDSQTTQRVGLTDNGDFVVRAQGVGMPSYGSGYGGLSPFPSATATLGGSWAGGYGVNGDVDGDGNGNPYDYTLAGTAFGIEQNLTPSLLMGLVGGYSHNDFDMDRLRSSADVDSYHAGVYAHLTEGIFYSSGLVAVGYQEYDTTRRILLPMGPRTASADYDGHELVTYIEKGMNLNLGGLRVQPLVGLQYLNLQRNAFNETGAGAVNLSVIEDHVDSLRLSAGGRIAPEMPPGFFGAILPEIRGRYVHEFLDDSQAISSSFAGAPGANFIATSSDLGRNFGVVGAGLNAQLSPMVRVFVDYDYTFSSSLEAHAGSGGLELVW